MRRSCCILFLVLATGFLFSCEQKVQDKKFFDVPGYFSGEIDSLSKSNFSFRKITVYNGDTSKMEIHSKSINWEKEFAIFLECDINKPAYYANMSKISTPSHAAQPMFGWSDKSEKLPIRYVMVEGYNYGEGSFPSNTTLIRIKMNKFNLISETTIDGLYIKDSVYEFRGSQKIKLSGETNTFFIQGKLK